MTYEEFWEEFFDGDNQKDIQDLIQQLDEYFEETKDTPPEPDQRCEDCLFVGSKDICLFCRLTKYEFDEKEEMPVLFRRHRHGD